MNSEQLPISHHAPVHEGVVARLGGKVRHWKERAAQTEKALAAANTELAVLRAKIQDPDEQARELAELKQRLRERDHFEKFAEHAKAAKAKDTAIKHLWRVSGYKAERDEIDEKALSELVKRLKSDVDYAFDSGEPERPSETSPAQRTRYGLELREMPEPAGAGRSARNTDGDGTLITAEMRADPKFMLDPRNKELIRDAALHRRFR
jgi:hypothetical protein